MTVPPGAEAPPALTVHARRRRYAQLGLGLAISAALIWWTFRLTDWDASWQFIVSANWGWMAVAVLLATIPFPLRIPRWKVLLRREDGSPLGAGPLWHAIAMGFAANNVLPLRAGEFIRIGAVSRLGKVPIATALSSVAVERVLDVLAAAGLLSVALVLGGVDPNLTLTEGGVPLSRVAFTVGALGTTVLTVAGLAAWQSALALRVARWALPGNRAGDTLYHVVERLLSGLSALRRPSTAIPALGWSLVIWVCNGTAFYAAFAAFGFEIPYSGAFVLQGALIIGIAIPSSPGYVGVFEAAIAGTLAALYGVPFAAGFAYGLSYHVTTFVPIILLGAFSAVVTGFRRGAPESEAD